MLEGAHALIDPGALAIVIAGTLLAATARCGWHDVRAAASALRQLWQPTFDADDNRAALARSIPEIRKRGHLCAENPLPPDPAFAALVEDYLVSGSIEGLHNAARAQRSTREIARARAVRVFDYAGELAPVFGLVGTLFAISQLSPVAGSHAAETTMQAVATAVLSSLYGVLTAHIVYIPLAGAIERRGIREEEARLELLDWFEAELTETRKHAPIASLKDVA